MREPLLLVGAGLLAGTMNAVAGGGSFVTLPALMFAGLPSVGANTSSTVALCPASLASAWAYREDFKNFDAGVSIRALLTVSLIGSVLGAFLLLLTTSKSFDIIVPWLLLIGTLVFAFGKKAGDALRRVVHIGPKTVLCLQFLLGIYGGYFGGAFGIMMMSVWSLVGVSDIKALNAAKTLVAGATNAIAVVIFIVAGKVWWPEALIMLVAAVVGGYVGARLARRVKTEYLRMVIIGINVMMTATIFYRTFG